MILLIFILLILSFFLKNIKENFTINTLPPVQDIECINNTNLDGYIESIFNNESGKNIYEISYSSIKNFFNFIFLNNNNIQAANVLFNTYNEDGTDNTELFVALFTLSKDIGFELKINLNSIINDYSKNYSNYNIYKYSDINGILINSIIYDNTTSENFYSLIQNIRTTSNNEKLLNNLKIRMFLRIQDKQNTFFNNFKKIYNSIMNNECSQFKNLIL